MLGITEILVRKNENHVHFLNMDISVNIAHTSFRFETCILEIQMQECMSRNSDIGPSFHFMKSRKLCLKK